MGACAKCPEFSESNQASTSKSDCKCMAGYYDSLPAFDEVSCAVCQTGFTCPEHGTTTATLSLAVGWYRTSSSSVDPRPCPDSSREDSGCVGGVGDEGPCKPWRTRGVLRTPWLRTTVRQPCTPPPSPSLPHLCVPCASPVTGPYCRLCNVSDGTRYYDPESSECLVCNEDSAGRIAALVCGFLAVLLVVALFMHFRPDRKWRRLIKFSLRFQAIYTQISLRAKLKYVPCCNLLSLMSCAHP